MFKTIKRESFEAEALPHLEIMWQTSLWMTKNGNEADNLVQDAYAEAYRLWDQIIPDINRKAWLFKVLTRLYLNDFQQKSTPSIPIIKNNIKESFFYSNNINSALANLPEDIRMVMLLSILGEFSYQEMAEITRSKLETVKLRLFQGRKLMQGELLAPIVNSCNCRNNLQSNKRRIAEGKL